MVGFGERLNKPQLRFAALPARQDAVRKLSAEFCDFGVDVTNVFHMNLLRLDDGGTHQVLEGRVRDREATGRAGARGCRFSDGAQRAAAENWGQPRVLDAARLPV